MSKKISIEGLVPVAPKVAEPKGPQAIEEKELEQIVRFYKGPQLDIQKAAGVLLDIQAKLQYRTDTGRNPDNASVTGFRVALISKTPADNQNPDFVSAGDSLVFISMKTGEHLEVDALPASGFPENSYHNPTANTLIEKDRSKG